MKPAGRRLMQAIVLALLTLSLSANVAVADDGLLASENSAGSVQTNLLPEDPGLE